MSMSSKQRKNIERFSEMLPFQYETAAVEVEAFRHVIRMDGVHKVVRYYGDE